MRTSDNIQLTIYFRLKGSVTLKDMASIPNVIRNIRGVREENIVIEFVDTENRIIEKQRGMLSLLILTIVKANDSNKIIVIVNTTEDMKKEADKLLSVSKDIVVFANNYKEAMDFIRALR